MIENSKSKPKAKAKTKPKAKARAKTKAPIAAEDVANEIKLKIEQLTGSCEGVPLIAMLADIQHFAMQLAEKEAGIDTGTESAHKAIGLLLLGIQRTADTRNTTHDAIVVELLDKLGAPHGIPTHAWN